MKLTDLHLLVAALGLLGGSVAFSADTPAPKPSGPDVSEFRTTATAKTTSLITSRNIEPAARGYLGVDVQLKDGKPTIAFVETLSPAQEAGVQVGDVIEHLGSTDIRTPDDFRGALRSQSPGDRIHLLLRRADKPLDLVAALAPASRPMALADQRATLGIRAADPLDQDGSRVLQVEADSPGAKAGVEIGDVLMRLDDTVLSPPLRLADILGYRKPGETVHLTLLRDGKEKQLAAKLVVGNPGGRNFGGRGSFNSDPRVVNPAFAARFASYFRRSSLHLLVLGIEFSDVKHNARVADKDWDEEFFSSKTFTARNATGQQVFGSLNDYFQEQSYGALRVEGKMAGWVELEKSRAEYDRIPAEASPDAPRGGNIRGNALLSDALQKYVDRDGRAALDSYDAVIFIYAGNRASQTRGSIFWPHKSNTSFQGRRWSYFICEEGAQRMTNVSLFGHEAGHILGLPDLYAQPENPGAVGLGSWCAMSVQVSNGRPQHYSAWCKEQLGWIKPAVIDPSVPQKLILSPVEDSATECFKVLIRPDGSEYLLLENRQRKGFDASLPADGLLIWRVVANRPTLEAAHGIGGPPAPNVFPASTPYPSSANNSFTPYTTPSSRSTLGGGTPVYITNVRRLEDGRITFYVGYQFE